MKIRKVSGFAAAAAVVLIAELLSARVDVKIDFDKNFDFTSVRTWNFDPAGSGEVKMARTQDDDPDAMKAFVEPIIIESIGAEMTRLRLTRQAEAPDVIARYYLLLLTSQNAQTMGQFLPGSVSWGLPPFLQSTQSLEIMNQGALVIDLASRGTVVWRGVAQAKLKVGLDRKKREQILREGVRDLLRRFPPKK
jgi:hypothetical protein